MLGATLCIFACIYKVTHFWPWAIRTFGPESDTHLIRSVCVFLCIWVQPNRIRRIRMRIGIRSTQCIAYHQKNIVLPCCRLPQFVLKIGYPAQTQDYRYW